MKKFTPELIVSLIIATVGFYLVADSAGGKTVIGVILMMWSNTIINDVSIYSKIENVKSEFDHKIEAVRKFVDVFVKR